MNRLAPFFFFNKKSKWVFCEWMASLEGNSLIIPVNFFAKKRTVEIAQLWQHNRGNHYSNNLSKKIFFCKERKRDILGIGVAKRPREYF